MDKIHFPTRTEFDSTLKKRVDDYLKSNNIPYSGTTSLHLKAIGILSFIIYFLIGSRKNTIGIQCHA